METHTPAQLLPHVDELVMEYLLFRGFTKSFQVFVSERKRDRAKGFDVEQLISQLLAYVQNYQIESILETWKFLSARFFNHVDSAYAATVQQLEDAWLRLYVVNAIKTGHREKAVEFFTLMISFPHFAQEDGDSWSRWFIAPYIQNPEQDPYFRHFFAKEWLESFVTSFRNFLSVIFHNLPLPKLLAFQITRLQEPSLSLRLKVSQAECSRLRLQNLQATERIRKLEDTGRQLYEMVRSMVQHSFMDHFMPSETPSEQSSPTHSPDKEMSLKTMAMLADRLKALDVTFAQGNSHQSGSEDPAPLLDPLRMKLHPMAPSADSDRGTRASASSSSVASTSPTTKKSRHAVRVTEVPIRCEDDETSLSSCAFTGDGRSMVITGSGHDHMLVVGNDVSQNCELQAKIDIAGQLVDADWIKDNRGLVFALDDGFLGYWDRLTGKTSANLASSSMETFSPGLLSCARQRNIGALALKMASSNEPDVARVQFFSTQSKTIEFRSTIDIEASEIVSMDWAHDGSLLVAGCVGGTVCLCSPTSDRITWNVSGDPQGRPTVSFAPSGESILTADVTISGTITEWFVDEKIRSFSIDQPRKKFEYRIPEDLLRSLEEPHVSCIQFNPVADRFVIAMSSNAGVNGQSLLLVFKSGDPHPERAPIHLEGCLKALVWRDDVHVLASVSRGEKAALYRFGFGTESE
ncbi:hypothetical protein Poli38472_009188 [Pythium oligandrum]|uniref:ARMC9 CTLH-like domain-containing protein n=1 Tax=Pythium oligandrum TaxID=41045 RepID=A0A8K1CLR6_PYTOL|nr:hypothetical protein Poli38472_009188 [Pythium oligandrum]|eukprot:TMW65021.1 hypothetical protein Poli38472_009188 [Pythium oligandrum]